MSVRSEREKSKMQEKYQMILAQMLKEDDNRFCVDCDTKSPRWASWNIGIFICIRCAGFHRNLGVHISKVKSVNLDSWTAEQIASMQAMGNNRARAVYEANLPAGFRRPQTDSALESFIRAKYEQRKWIAKEWIPPEITVSSDLIESEPTNPKRVETPSDSGNVEKSAQKNIPKLKAFSAPTATHNPVRQVVNDRPIPTVQATITLTPTTSNTNPAPKEDSLDLLGLDEPSLPITSSNNLSHSSMPIASNNVIDPLHEIFATTTITTTATYTNENNSTLSNFDSDLQSAFSSTNDNSNTTNTNNVLTNDKILALFNQPPSTPNTAMNIRPGTIQTPNTFMPPQHHLLAHQKSASFGSNLSQQTTHQFGAPSAFQQQQPYPFPPRPGQNPMHHNNPNNMSSPTLQTPTSTFTPTQLTNQFSQFVPFANSKTNTTASLLISGMPTRPVTEYMPASSDPLWQ